MKDNKKIAIILPFERKGGLERMASVLASYLADNGFKVSFIMTKQNEELYEKREDIIYSVLPHDESKNRVLRVIDKILTCRKLIKKQGIKTIISFGHFGTFFAIPASLGIRVKHISAVRTDPAKEPTTSLLRMIRNIFYHKSSVIVFQTNDAKEYFSKALQKKAVIIPNPISENLPLPNHKGKRDKVIVNFTRLTKQKNLELLLNAFHDFHKYYPEYKLAIYGKGDIKEELLHQINQLRLTDSIFIEDFVTNIHDTIINSSMFVSTSDYEGISNSMLESMAIGLPVICTDCPVGGAHMVIRNYENGILVPVRDRKALVESMKYLAENPDKAETMGVNAMAIRQEYSMDKIMIKWLEVVSEI